MGLSPEEISEAQQKAWLTSFNYKIALSRPPRTHSLKEHSPIELKGGEAKVLVSEREAHAGDAIPGVLNLQKKKVLRVGCHLLVNERGSNLEQSGSGR